MKNNTVISVIIFIVVAFFNFSPASADEKQVLRNKYESINQQAQAQEMPSRNARSTTQWPSEHPASAATEEFHWFDEKFNIYLWRDDDNIPWIEIDPISSSAFICGAGFDIFQKGEFRLDDDGTGVVYLKDSSGESFCDDLSTKAIFQLAVWSFLSDRADVKQAFDLYFSSDGSATRDLFIRFNSSDPAPTPSPLATFGSNLSNSNKLFNFAEKTFPELFSPSGVETFEVDYDSKHFIVRYYADSNTYIGTVGEDIYVYGDVFGGLLEVGKISDYIQVDPNKEVFILNIATEIEEGMSIPRVLSPNKLAIVSTSNLLDSNIKIIINTARGEMPVALSNVSLNDGSITFEVPADMIPGSLSILGKDYVVSQAYQAFYSTTPYITLLSPALAQVGDRLEITGKNLPESPVQLIFEGQGSDLTQTLMPVDGKVSFTVPDNVASGSIYLQVGQLQTNRLYLSVKRNINAHVQLGTGINFKSSEISFILGLEEHYLDSAYTTSLNVENLDMQYLHAMVDLPDGASSLLYSSAVLPDMSGTISVNAKSTAVAWVLMGMGASVTMEKDQLRSLYDAVVANAQVQVFADYIDTLQKNDFTAWVTRSDSELKRKYQEALKGVITTYQLSKSARSREGRDTGVDENSIIIEQVPENSNIYFDPKQLDGGNVTIINDTKLYLSVEVRSNEEKNKNQIVAGYKHVGNAIITDAGTLIGPKGWGLLGISSAETLELKGEDSNIQIISAAWPSPSVGGSTTESGLSDSLRARVFLEGVALPSLNMLLTTIMDKRVANGYKASNLADAMQTIYGGTDFIKQLTTQVSSSNTSFGAIADNLIIMPLRNGFNSCFQVPEGDACGKTMLGVAKLLGITEAENFQKKIMLLIANSIEKRILKKSVALIPFAGWIAEAAFFVHDNISYISDSATITESLYDMRFNPQEINIDVEFPLNISSLRPICVAATQNDTMQNFQIQGNGFAPVGDQDPQVYIGTGNDKTEAARVSVLSTGEDMTAEFSLFDLDGLLREGSWTAPLFVRNYGYSVMYPDFIRMVSAEDDVLYFDSITPERSMRGDTLILKGCGWVPLEDVEVRFQTQDGEVNAKIIEKKADRIKVEVPVDAITGLVYVTTSNKESSQFFQVDDFGLTGVTSEDLRIKDNIEFGLNGSGLADTAHVYFIDHLGKQLEGVASNITKTGMWVKAPSGLAAGKVRVYVVLTDGKKSNELILAKIPQSPIASPSSGVIGEGITVTLSQEDGVDIYYRLNDNTVGTEKKYTGTLVFTADDLKYTELYLYAFARINVDGVNYDSNIVDFSYYPCAEGERFEGGECAVDSTPVIDNEPSFVFDRFLYVPWSANYPLTPTVETFTDKNGGIFTFVDDRGYKATFEIYSIVKISSIKVANTEIGSIETHVIWSSYTPSTLSSIHINLYGIQKDNAGYLPSIIYTDQSDEINNKLISNKKEYIFVQKIFTSDVNSPDYGNKFQITGDIAQPREYQAGFTIQFHFE